MTVLSSQEVYVFCCATKSWEHHLRYLSKEKLCNWFLVGLADVPQSCQQNVPYFLPCTKCFSTLAVYRGEAYSIRDK